jgi:hypothetical protein
MSAEPAMIEPFSSTLTRHNFHALLRKRAQWHHVLERRVRKKQPLPALWVISAGRPGRVLRDHGFVRSQNGPRGHYVIPAPGWNIHLLVATELPRTQETVLLRLLGPTRIRLEAIAELIRMPENAWERTLALPWLLLLRFEVPADPGKLPEAQRGLTMEIQEWFERYKQRLEEKGRKRGVREGRERGVREGRERGVREGRERGVREGRERGVREGRTQVLTRLFEKRLGRPLNKDERSLLAERLERLGEERLGEVVLELGAEPLRRWLSDPAAR